MIGIHAAIQVEKLLQVIHPEANIRPTATSSAPEDPLVQPPVAAPSHDGGLDQAAKLATVTAELEALKLNYAEQQAKQQAFELDKAEQDTEIKKLRGKVTVTTPPIKISKNLAYVVRRAFRVLPPFSIFHHATPWAR